MSIRYLLFTEDLEQLGCYSWGAAVLAYMYRGFDRASMGERVEVAAFSPLLQLRMTLMIRHESNSLTESTDPGIAAFAARIVHLTDTGMTQAQEWHRVDEDVPEGVPEGGRADRGGRASRGGRAGGGDLAGGGGRAGRGDLAGGGGQAGRGDRAGRGQRSSR
ncbi:uncharacterized protein LOC132629010 [Lycium barbarum]|uniref:uncharacterized protein LOC132629010 n=1 Tax=Lycium barbarum TaxID=112863 RepID=UPI00293E6567|nr:uncharacterized protein LOC132629010 [Lycium barbarum]